MINNNSYEGERILMVEEQLIPRGIKDARLLDAFRIVNRHEFVSLEYKDQAYADHPLPIGEGQTISQPYMVALMTECLGLKGEEKVLEVGAGSGYQAAILSVLAKEVYTIDRIPGLVKKAEQSLKRLGYNNVFLTTGDGTLGWPEHSPYDGIIVTAGSPSVPPRLIEQLKIGGRLVIPVGSSFSQSLTIVEKTKKGLTQKEVCGCVFVPLIGKDAWQGQEY